MKRSPAEIRNDRYITRNMRFIPAIRSGFNAWLTGRESVCGVITFFENCRKGLRACGTCGNYHNAAAFAAPTAKGEK